MEQHTLTSGMRIAIDMGTPMFVQIAGLQEKFKTHLVGVHHGHYLIVTTPVIPPAREDSLYKGNPVRVRYINEGTVYGFETRILGECRSPAKLLFLIYPNRVKEQSLRKADRHDCYLPCEVGGEELAGEGTIVDISTAGCRCIVPMINDADALHAPRTGSRIELKLADPGLTLHGSIVNTSEYHAAARVGIRFEDVDDDTRQGLQQLILGL